MATLTPKTSLLFLSLAALFALPTTSLAQTYRDFLIVRNREQPHRSLVQIRAGYRAVDPEGENLNTGLVDDAAVDGFILYHSSEVTAKQDWNLDIYAGRDGIYLGLKDDLSYGKKAQARLELFGRPKAFYREGFYQKGKYVTTGQYEGRDYGLRVTSAQELEKGIILDIGVFGRTNEFDRNNQTRPDFIIPDDYYGYGGSIAIEQNNVKLDRQLGLPQAGVLMTVMVEYELNTSKKSWGSPAYRTKLPDGFYRADARVEFYVPNAKSGVWEILADLGYYDSEDRVTSYHAEHMQGYIWGDGTLGYRMSLGESFVFKPFAQLQYTKILDQNGVTSSEEFFWGGGINMALIFSQNMALVLEYSYVDNPSRDHASLANDFYGEHQLFFGMDVSFGSGYRR
jgi:hypothetical protein